MGQTTNYQLPTYEAGDAPDLTGAYNDAMGKIDVQMHANATTAAQAETDATTANSGVASLDTRVTALEQKGGDFQPADDDESLTVSQLSAAKVTKNGIIYFKEG